MIFKYIIGTAIPTMGYVCYINMTTSPSSNVRERKFSNIQDYENWMRTEFHPTKIISSKLTIYNTLRYLMAYNIYNDCLYRIKIISKNIHDEETHARTIWKHTLTNEIIGRPIKEFYTFNEMKSLLLYTNINIIKKDFISEIVADVKTDLEINNDKFIGKEISVKYREGIKSRYIVPIKSHFNDFMNHIKKIKPPTSPPDVFSRIIHKITSPHIPPNS
jgi:hypothetical protein